MAKITFLNIFALIMELFYTNNVLGNVALFDQQESVHCVRVLRHREGDIVSFTDGCGYLYSAKIVDPNPKMVKLDILGREEGPDKREYGLHMAVALTKNIERFEWFLEKAVEIGVDRVTPLICEHSERKVYKKERAQRIVLSAMKQSLKTVLPVLDDAAMALDLIDDSKDVRGLCRIMGHCRDGQKLVLPSILQEAKSAGNNDFLIMIGPEGDFSVGEISKATDSGFLIMDLGKSIMRVETAALTCVGGVYLTYLFNR